MGITVIALIFVIIAFCLCKWGPQNFGWSIFMLITGLLLASSSWAQQVTAFVVDLVNSLIGGVV